MAPAMDMRWDKTAMAQCFYMTNMCPQDTKLNNDHWRVLEEKVHRWAKRDKRILVFTGPIMGKSPKRIGKNKADIAVPDAFFKVLYAPDQGRAIAFIYPNQPCPGGIGKYAVTVAEVERRTGLTFSSAIPKRQCKVADWE
jgi:endonuclease G